MQVKYKTYLNFIVSGRYELEEDEEHLKLVNPVPPKYGFNWWFSKPNFYFDLNNTKGTTTVFEISFLCFKCYLDNYKRLDKR